MASRITYVNVTFTQDWPYGPYVFPSGLTCSLPEDVGKGVVSSGFARLNYVGTTADRLTPVGAIEVDANAATVQVRSDDSAATIASKISTVRAETVNNSPEGVGSRVELPAARVTTGALTLSQGQSLRGVKGSTILTLADDAVLPDLGGGVAGYLTISADYRSHGGVAGQGVIEDLDIDAGASKAMVTPTTIHALYAPERVGDATLHTMRNVAVYGAKNNGIHFDGGNDKLVAYRLRSENCDGVGIYVSGSDCKGSDFGAVAKGSSCEINSAAIELDKFDFWRSSGATADPTLKITGATNGCVIKSGTVEGKTLFIGKNESAANRYINSKAQFAFVHFKLDTAQTADCYFEAQSADLVELISCKFGLSGNSVVTPYDYLIKITNTGGVDRNGVVKIIGGSGMVRFLGRPGATNKMRMDCVKHYCDLPRRVLFEWGVPGQVEIVPNWACDAVDPELRTHIRFDGVARNKEDFPFGFLAWGIDKGVAGAPLMLDDVATTFTVDELPVLSSSYCYAMRVVP